MNLKERLSSTENLLRSIRSGEAFSSPAGDTKKSPENAGSTAIWSRRLSLGGLLARRKGGDSASKPAPGKPFWNRQLNFGRRAKSTGIGVSVSGTNLCLTLVRCPAGDILAAGRFPMTPEQAPGEKDFPEFFRSCLEPLGEAANQAEVWAILRSADLDLNVLSVPRLSGGKLDAAVYWTLQKEKKFAEAEYVLDYLPMGPTLGALEARLDVLTCLARRADVDRLREAFRDAGHPLTGITAIPNSLLNLYRLPGAPRGHTLAANIHVEPDFSAIGLYSQDRLFFSRFIRSGASGMAEALVEHFQELAKPKPAPGGDLELPLPGAPQTLPGDQTPAILPPDSTQAMDLFRHVLLGAPKPAFASPGHLLSPQQMLDIVAPAIERMARQVERTLDYYATSQQTRCDALHLSGDVFGSPLIMQALGAQLGFSPVAFDATAIVAQGGDRVVPEDRMSMAPALSAALSAPGKGINLLRNYKLRTAEEARRTVTHSLILGLAGLMLVIGAAGFWLERGTAAKRQELAGVRARLAAMGPVADEASLMASVAQFKLRQDGLREAASRFAAPAVLAEISRRAPVNVRILNLTLDMQGAAPAAGAAPGAAPAKPAPGLSPLSSGHDLLVLEGVITGSKNEFEATLSRFVIDLQASPLFSLPTVNQTGLKDLGSEGQVLYFVLHVGVN